MRAHVRTPTQEAMELPTSDVPRTGAEINEGNSNTGQRIDIVTNQESALDQATREVAEMQAQWSNRRDLWCSYTDSRQPGGVDITETDNADNQVTSTLLIAQHEWRKVLDGTNGAVSRQPSLPVAEAIYNKSWGDECHEKPRNVFRLFAQNVNGLTLDRRGGQFDSLSQVQKETQSDVFLGQEHNLDSTQFQVKSILHAMCKQHWELYRLNIATTPISFKSMYKPGGTFMLAAGNATGRILSETEDKWGRWVSQTFQGAAWRTITIVSAYQVVTDVARGGSTTASTQQYSLLVNDQDSTKAPRAAFRRDLKNFLQQCRTQGEKLILVGDFNEAIGEEVDGVISLVQSLDLVDMMGARHNYALPTTYTRGRRCLDYGFAMPNVCTALDACGYESFGLRFPSDHRAYFFDFDTRKLFGSHIQTLSKFAPRQLQSTNAKQVTAYLRKMNVIMESCDAYARGDQLSNPGRRDAFAERLDSDVLNGSLVSESALPVFQVPEWSKALADARVQASVLSKLLSCLRTTRPFPQAIVDQFQQLGQDWTLPQSKTSCQDLLTSTRKNVQTLVKDSFSQRNIEFRN